MDGCVSSTKINIAHGTMRKALEVDEKNVKVYSFIPSYKLPKNCPHKYDAFLEPLMEELEELYIDGMEVLFSMSVEAYPPNDCVTLRVVQLLFTADMVAHAELGLQSSSGYKGCRHCEVEAEYNDNHCRFGIFQERYTTPACDGLTFNY